MTAQIKELPAFARLMRETSFAKGEEALVENGSGQEKSAPALKPERSSVGAS